MGHTATVPKVEDLKNIERTLKNSPFFFAVLAPNFLELGFPASKTASVATPPLTNLGASENGGFTRQVMALFTLW